MKLNSQVNRHTFCFFCFFKRNKCNNLPELSSERAAEEKLNLANPK